MPTDTETNPHRIETGRSWRDLPPEPPSTAPLRPPATSAQPSTTAARSWPWARIGLGAAALAIGISVGVWAPWSGAVEDTPQPRTLDELPEAIVPDPPQDFGQEPTPPDDPFGVPPEGLDTPEEFLDQIPEDFLDQIPEDFLDQLPDGFFDGLPGAAVETNGLIEFGELPDGYQARSNVFSESTERASQRIRLLGPAGPVDVQAIRGPDVSLPTSGEPFSVGDAEGKLTTTDDATTLSWLADDVLITVEVASGFEIDILAAIANAVEVSR